MAKKRGKQCHISVYVTQELKDKAARAAAADQRKLSDWFRIIIARAAEARS